MRHALRLRLISLRQKGGVVGFFDHLEQTADFDDTMVVDIAGGDETTSLRARAMWNSVIPAAIRDWQPEGDPLADADPRPACGVAGSGFRCCAADPREPAEVVLTGYAARLTPHRTRPTVRA